jgi:hypothetical protein
MKKLVLLTLLAVVSAITIPHLFVRAQNQKLTDAATRRDQDLAKVFRKHERLKMYPAAVADQVRRTKQLSIYTGSASFDLELEPHDVRARNYRAVAIGADGVERRLEKGPVITYKGKVLGREDAQARFTIDDDKLQGLIITPEERYMLEPARKYTEAADATEFVLYRSSDVIKNPAMTCAVTMDEEIKRTVDSLAPSIKEAPQAPSAIAALREIEIATEADGEYVRAEGGAAAANSNILGIINQIDGVYQRDLQLALKVVFQSAWDSATTDPYVKTALGDQLTEFQNEWNATRTDVRRDVAHVWTGKQGGAGLAWSGLNNINGVVCRNGGTYSYGISGRFPFTPQEYILTAHEIGHNLSATHQPDSGACANSIMNPGADNATLLTFCQASRTEITNYVAQFGTCLTTQTTTCTYTLSPTSKTFTATGGSDSVSIAAGPTCQWTAQSNAAWIHITTATSGTGPGAVGYSVDVNTTTTARTGTLIIAGKSLTITQAGQAASLFTISGKITTSTAPNGIAGMTVKLTGPRTLTAITNSLGNYTFTGLPPGNYRVTPSRLGYVFSPAFRAYNNLSANQTAANFVAAQRNFTITAQARNAAGVGVSGVIMKLTGMRTLTCTTGATGLCKFPNLPAGGSFTVTPTKTGVTFTPVTRVYSSLNANVTASFTAAP